MRRVGLVAIAVGAIAASISYFFSQGLADGFILGGSVGAAIGLIAARRSM
jgi:drug/metabolite transporter (DMT)-like permease